MIRYRLARPAGQAGEVDAAVATSLTEFVVQVFQHVPGKQVRVGAFRDAAAASAFVAAHADASR
jgi:hypothetical protein